jgi:hypothetical protein
MDTYKIAQKRGKVCRLSYFWGKEKAKQEQGFKSFY